MKQPKNRFAYMIVGIFIGVLIAFSIAWWQGNSIGEWGLFKKVKAYFSRSDDHSISVVNENANNKENLKSTPKLNNEALKNDSAYYDSTNIDLYDPNALDEFLAKYNGHLPDSLVLDSIIKSQNNVDINSYSAVNNVEVKKDKLIFAKSYNIPGLEMFSADNPGRLDSLLTDNKSGSANNNKNLMKVEYWKSPINYKGYKTGKNKLVLFGIDNFEMVSFRVFNKSLYMKYMSEYYLIDKTEDFKSLIPVSNQQLITQLNSK